MRYKKDNFLYMFSFHQYQVRQKGTPLCNDTIPVFFRNSNFENNVTGYRNKNKYMRKCPDTVSFPDGYPYTFPLFLPRLIPLVVTRTPAQRSIAQTVGFIRRVPPFVQSRFAIITRRTFDAKVRRLIVIKKLI